MYPNPVPAEHRDAGDSSTSLPCPVLYSYGTSTQNGGTGYPTRVLCTWYLCTGTGYRGYTTYSYR